MEETRDMQELNYRTAIIKNLSEILPTQWEECRNAPFNEDNNPFLSYAYLRALEAAGCACPKTGWRTHFLTLWQFNDTQNDTPTSLENATLVAALPLYIKSHSYGEYVFDWAWANAYAEHNLDYYPKLLSAIPFTPVSGARLLARNASAMQTLIVALNDYCEQQNYSSCHVLFLPKQQATALQQAGMMLRHGVQFHWSNQNYADFDAFLAQLNQKKRKNINAELRKVREAGITFKHLEGAQISETDWDFFVRCYDNTYAQHGGKGYLNRDFFGQIGAAMPDNLLMIIAMRDNQPIATSLLFKTDDVMYGRYWGAVEYHPCLHFETAYYQPLEYCIKNKINHFEGGAQGEHKMARGFLPTPTYSAHHIQHPAFRDAIARFLTREQAGMAQYVDELTEHSPFDSKHNQNDQLL